MGGQRPLRILLAAAALLGASSAAPAEPPARYELQLVHIFDGPKTEHIFVIGESGFRTVASLKAFLATLPKGTELRWAPGCERFGDEPLLSSEQDLAEFKAFLEQRGIRLVLVPSG